MEYSTRQTGALCGALVLRVHTAEVCPASGPASLHTGQIQASVTEPTNQILDKSVVFWREVTNQPV